MPANTYTLIEKIVVGAAGASSITFTSIPQTYTDLVIKLSTRISTAAGREGIKLTFNGNASSYSYRRLYGFDSSSTGSDNASSQTSILIGNTTADGATTSTFGNHEIYIPNYTSSNNKSTSSDAVAENNSASNWQVTLGAGMWSNTGAITSITLTTNANNFMQHSTFYLYGIAKEGVSPSLSSAPYATGGDRILFDGTYWYHAFTSTGTFTPTRGLSCDVLVVAGGGGGGTYAGGGGGGGAGGLLAHTSQSLTSSTNYTVTIGSGGGANTNGSNSQFGSLTASVGGGKGGGSGATAGGNGGSGGGSCDGGAVGTGTSGQGNNGGTGTGAQSSPGGGGGGAGAAGQNADGASNPNIAGAGGAGVNTYSSWATATSTGASGFYAGGGGGGVFINAAFPNNGGGAGGSGGGGSGSATNKNGTANTGGGGGGGAYTSSPVAPGTGGSGIVIVRYAA